MSVWVASGGEALPLFHRETVGRDALAMLATSEPLSPPRCFEVVEDSGDRALDWLPCLRLGLGS